LSVDVDTLNTLEALPEDKLIQELKNKMKGRYLVVLENISTVVEWNTVRAYLPDRKNSSWIIISTTQSEIARLFVGDPWQALEHKQYSAEYSVCFLREVRQLKHNRTVFWRTTSLILS
jgi:hypothetical protein